MPNRIKQYCPRCGNDAAWPKREPMFCSERCAAQEGLEHLEAAQRFCDVACHGWYAYTYDDEPCPECHSDMDRAAEEFRPRLNAVVRRRVRKEKCGVCGAAIVLQSVEDLRDDDNVLTGLGARIRCEDAPYEHRSAPILVRIAELPKEKK